MWYRAIGWAVLVPFLAASLFDYFDPAGMLTVGVSMLVGGVGSVLVSVAVIRYLRFRIPAALFILAALLPCFTLIPVPNGTLNDLFSFLAALGMACYFLGVIVGLVVAWSTPIPPRT
jgi:hypothetical protein